MRHTFFVMLGLLTLKYLSCIMETDEYSYSMKEEGKWN